MSVLDFYEEATAAFPPVILGHTEDGEPIVLDYEQLQYHTQIIGLSGQGKSRAIEYLLRQFLLNRVGFTLIDPHGDIYNALVAWLANQDDDFLDDRRIHLLDPAHATWRFGYNPLHLPDDTPAALREAAIMDRVDAIMKAISQVMGGEDPDAMPLYQRTFSTVIYTLGTKGLTFYEAMRLLPATEEAFRRYITQDLPDPVARATWDEMHAWSHRQFTEFMGSLYSRMHRIMRHPFIRQILSQTESVLDIRRVMDQGEVVLANFQDRQGFPLANAELLARLLLSDYTQTALGRVANESRPHFLVIDECYRFLTSDIEAILDQTRKFGLHLMLAHQRLSQLGREGEPIYEGIMEGAQNKVIFGTTYRSAQELADRLFAHEYDLERAKGTLDKEMQVGVRRTILTGRSRGRATSESWAHGTTTMASAVAGLGESFDAAGNPIGSMMSGATGEQSGESATSGGSVAEISAESEHEAFEPIFETRPSAVHTLEEERHRKAVELTVLDKQHVIIRTADRKSTRGTTATFDRLAPPPEQLAACLDRLFEESDYNTLVETVERQLEERWRDLDQLVDRFKHPEPVLRVSLSPRDDLE